MTLGVKASNKPDLLSSERRTRRGYYVFDARLVQRNDVGVAFGEVANILLPDTLLGLKNTV